MGPRVSGELGAGHALGARRAARLVFNEDCCQSVLLCAIEEKDQHMETKRVDVVNYRRPSGFRG